MSDHAVNAREPYQGCGQKSANGGTLRARAYDNPVPSPKTREGVTTMSLLLSTVTIDTCPEVRANYKKYS